VPAAFSLAPLGAVFVAEGVCSEKGRHPTLNVPTERKQVIAREKYHHEEQEGHKVKLIVKFFVIFVYFVVDKYYNMSLALEVQDRLKTAIGGKPCERIFTR
jgi:hypothetical protein